MSWSVKTNSGMSKLNQFLLDFQHSCSVVDEFRAKLTTEDTEIAQRRACYGAIVILPILLVWLWALIATLQTPGAKPSGNLNTIWVKPLVPKARTSSAGTSKL